MKESENKNAETTTVLLGDTLCMVGFNSHRLKQDDTFHKKECDFVKAINEEMKLNPNTLAHIVNHGQHKEYLEEKEEKIVLSVIQWLGTPFGQGFLNKVTGRLRDNSGIANTCPKIDEVISAIESVNWGEDNYWDANSVKTIMEEIRKSNSDLRDWGNEMCRERDELQEQIDDLQKENKSLKIDIDYYEKQLTN